MAADLDALRADKRAAQQLVEQLRQENRELAGRLRDVQTEALDATGEAERCRLQLAESQARLDALRAENSELRAEKSRAAHKAGLLDDENGNLRREIFALKQLMLEYDRREMLAERSRLSTRHPPDFLDLSSYSSQMHDAHPPDDPARDPAPRIGSASDLRAAHLLAAARRAQPAPLLQDQPRFASPRLPRSINSPGLAERSNILTWNQPYEGTRFSAAANRDALELKRRDKERPPPDALRTLQPEPGVPSAGKHVVSPRGGVPLEAQAKSGGKKLGPRFASPQEGRPSQEQPAKTGEGGRRPTIEVAARETERLQLEKQLQSLSQARDAVDWGEQALAEASRLDSKPRSGVAAKKKRELEAAVESLDKEVASTKSRLRMLLNNKY